MPIDKPRGQVTSLLDQETYHFTEAQTLSYRWYWQARTPLIDRQWDLSLCLALQQFKRASWHVLFLLPKIPLSRIFVLLPSWHKEISPRSPLRSLLWTPQLNQQPVHTVLYPSCCGSVSKWCPTLCNPTDATCQLLWVPLSSRVYSISCPLSQWCHPTISSSAIPFSSCLQSFPASAFSNESALRIRWLKYWSFSFSISPSNEYSRMISFRIDWFDLFSVQGTLKNLLYLTVHFIFLKATNTIRIDTSYLFGTPSYIMQAPFGRWFSMLFISLPPESVQRPAQDRKTI